MELRLAIGTSKDLALNIHLLISPEDNDHVQRARQFLQRLGFSTSSGTYYCHRDDLIRPGRDHDKSITKDNKALEVGTSQFKIEISALKKEWEGDKWATDNIIIAVAGGSNDGTAGVQDNSFAILRRSIEAFSSIIFASQLKQREYWLGKLSVSREELDRQYHGQKLCLHGSDAHDLGQVGRPALNRFCWLKGDVKFETLRQACIEPEARAWIGEEPPSGSFASQTISTVRVDGADWLGNSEINLNPGLVAIIGPRGSGKTALADIIAAGAGALVLDQNSRSFVARARNLLKNETVELSWVDGETSNFPLIPQKSEFPENPHIQYLSQQFVDRLCSAEGVTDELLEEVKRVVFQSHAIEDRLGTAHNKGQEIINRAYYVPRNRSRKVLPERQQRRS